MPCIRVEYTNQEMACDTPGCHTSSLPHIQSDNLAKWPLKRWEGGPPTSRSYALQSPRITGGFPHVNIGLLPTSLAGDLEATHDRQVGLHNSYAMRYF